MTLIFPKKIDGDNDYNYKLAEYMQTYAKERKGELQLSRKSSDAPEIEPLVCTKTVDPDIFIGLYVGEYTGGTYILVCDAYSALAGTWNYLCKNEFGDPVKSDNAGLDISGNLTLSKKCDVTLHLPALVADYDDTKLKELAQKLIEEAYWYPIYTKDDGDKPGLVDPYLYRFSRSDTWHETLASEQGSTGRIGFDDTNNDKELHYLEIDSKEVEAATETKSYTWTIPLKDVSSSAKKIIFTAKGMSGGEKIYVKVTGATSQIWTDTATTSYTKYSDHTLTLSPASLTTLELGVTGPGKVRFTGIWVADSEDAYQLLPYPYRKEYPEEEIEGQSSVPTEPCVTLTKGATLEERAEDKIAAPEPEQEEDDPEDPGGGASTATAAGFGAVAGILGSLLDGSTAVTDLASLMKVDTKALEDKMNAAMDFGDKLGFSKTKEKLEGIKNGALAQAAELEKVASDKMAALNSSMSLDNLKGSFSIQMPKIPSPESLAGVADLASKAQANLDSVKGGISDLTGGLDKLTGGIAALKDAQSQLAQVQGMMEQAKGAVDSALASAKSQLPSTTSIGGISL